LAYEKIDLVIVASENKVQEYQNFVSNLKNNYVCEDLDDSTDLNQKCIVVLGGDGSLNYFINTLTEKQLEQDYVVVYFPLGTANDFARNFRLEKQFPEIDHLDFILKSNLKMKVPLMKCNNRRFINALSAGSIANVTESSSDQAKDILGTLSYYLDGASELLNLKKYDFKISNKNDEQNISSFGFLVSQGSYAGGGLKITSSMANNFGESFEFVSVESVDVIDTLKSLVEMQKVKPDLGSIPVKSLFTDHLVITSESEIPVKLDGELYTSNSFDIRKDSTYINFLFY
jgi:diacylglycerol kinase (ATP)